MESKLNYAAVEQYATEAAQRLRTQAYADTMHLDGPGLLSASPLKQVNLLVVHKLFYAWQQQRQAQRSPYFDFDHDDVKAAEKEFANTLSRHIALRPLDYQQLATAALVDALCLIFSPYDYYLRLINQHQDQTRVSRRELKELKKYVKVNAQPLEALIAKMKAEGKKEAFNDEAHRLLNEALEEGDFTPVEVDEYLELFSQIQPLDLATVYQEKDEALPVATPKAPAAQEPEPVLNPEPPTAKEQPKDEPEEEASEPAPAEEEPSSSPEESTEGNQEDDQPASPDSDEVGTFADRLVEKHGEQSLAEAHEKQPSDSIKSTISINRKFMFINELFDGEAEAFAEAVVELDQKGSFEEAMQHIQEHISTRYNWRADSEAVGEFLLLLEKRFPEG